MYDNKEKLIEQLTPLIQSAMAIMRFRKIRNRTGALEALKREERNFMCLLKNATDVELDHIRNSDYLRAVFEKDE